MPAPPVRIAIVGGGLGGTVLMSSMMQHPHLDVHLFEANTELKERGASIGLCGNAQRALALLGLPDVVEKAKGVRVASFRLVVGSGPDAGKTIADPVDDLITVHRAALLGELVKSIPRDRIHFSKRLVRINGNTIHFQDESIFTADLIIGSDGIHSNVRKFCLGEGHPAVEPVFAGFWDVRAVLPMAKITNRKGMFRTNREHPRQHSYVGDKCFMLHDIIDDGENVCLVAAGIAPPDWDKSSWKKTVSRSWLEQVFTGWGELGQSTLDLMFESQDELSVFVQWASAKAPKLYRGSICLMGDAAHATTPWQGSGLAVAIEDALFLQTLLGRCEGTHDVPAALEAYDQTMRPRGQSVVDSSHETGLMSCGSVGLDVDELAMHLAHRWDFINKWDTEAAVQDAIKKFECLKLQLAGQAAYKPVG